MKFPQKIAAAAAALWLAGAAHAADLPTFKLEMTDGKLNPARIEVPAGQRFKIEIRNTGKGAAEFESVQLRRRRCSRRAPIRSWWSRRCRRASTSFSTISTSRRRA